MPRDIRAFAFDLDETLVDAEYHHEEATRAMLAAAGEDLEHVAREVFRDVTGKRTRDIVEAFRVASGIPHALDDLLIVRTRAFREAAERVPPPMMPGARALLDACAARGPVALVTSGHVGDALATLEVLGIHGIFAAIVTGEDVEHPKPHPEPYAMAAEALEVDPEEMLVFEDSRRGVLAAKAAGCRVVAVPNERNTPRDIVQDADVVLGSMRAALPLDALLARLAR